MIYDFFNQKRVRNHQTQFSFSAKFTLWKLQTLKLNQAISKLKLIDPPTKNKVTNTSDHHYRPHHISNTYGDKIRKEEKNQAFYTMIIMIPNDNDSHNNDQMITTDRSHQRTPQRPPPPNPLPPSDQDRSPDQPKIAGSTGN